MFPKTLTKNISFIFTNVSSPLHWNFCGDTIPDVLKDAPQFCLNNPIALHRKYVKLKDDPNTRKLRADFHKAVKASEQDTLEMLVEFFDWLHGLEQQPATEISLFEKEQNNRSLTANALNKKVKESQVSRSYHLACTRLSNLILIGNRT